METYGSAIILCGGKSSRMGFDKSRIKIGDKLLVELIAEELKNVFNEIILVEGEIKKFEGLGYRVAEDVYKECGPACGIYTGLKAASSRYVFVTACDMPFINIELINYMTNIIKNYQPDCIISRNGNWIEPFYAFYTKDMINTFNTSISEGNFKLFEIIRKHNVHYIDENMVRKYSRDLEVFINLNYSKDLDILKKYGKEVEVHG